MRANRSPMNRRRGIQRRWRIVVGTYSWRRKRTRGHHQARKAGKRQLWAGRGLVGRITAVWMRSVKLSEHLILSCRGAEEKGGPPTGTRTQSAERNGARAEWGGKWR